MGNLHVTSLARRAGPLTRLAVLGMAAVALAGCAGGAIFDGKSSPSSSSSPSFGDRFTQLFGGKSQEASTVAAAPKADDENSLTCPSVTIRPGASTYAVGQGHQPAAGADLRFQATITRTARDCNLANGQITARIGIQGRVIVGPAGAPSRVDIPLRVALVQEGVSPKTITTKAYTTSVEITTENSVPFSLVVEDLVYPAPTGADGDSYVFYIGFDPATLKPEPRRGARRR